MVTRETAGGAASDPDDAVARPERSPRPLRAITNVFAGSPLDRAGDRRLDDEWLASALARPDARVVAFRKGDPLVAPAPPEDEAALRLAAVSAETAKALAVPGDRLLFLGFDGGSPVFGVEIDDARPEPDLLSEVGRFEGLRAAALALAGPEAAIAGTAASLFNWRRRHPFCAACGSATHDAGWGWYRVCPACGTEHFPRVDPVVIMLPVYGDRCCLGRGRGWPPGRMSALAGFVEPGESVEEACARELYEEAGLVATRVAYHSSQPWPFPSSLMLGLVAEVAGDETTPDGAELEEVRWLTREEARDVLDGRHREIQPPSPIAIARRLLAAWVEGASPADGLSSGR